jgi:RNA polymerase sigma-70 factor (sigma-E family)
MTHYLSGKGAAISAPGDRQAAGDRPAAVAALDIAALFREQRANLIRLAALLVGDLPTAEDVVQDFFAKLHARRDRMALEGDLLAYARTCVVNGCRTVQRRRAIARRVGAGRDPYQDWPQQSAEYEAIRSENRREVMAALATLPRRRKEVLVLRYYLGLSEAEIAEVLKITPGTVKSTAARGLATLASALGEEA